MEPNEPNNHPVYGTVIQPEQPRRPRKKKLLILIAVLILIVLAAVIFAVVKGKKSDSNNGQSKVDTSDTSLYYDRPGYDRKTLRADVGDPMAIKLQAKNETQTLTSGVAVIPACSVISTSDLDKASLKLYVNGYGWPIQQSYLSKSGKASFGPDLNNMPLNDGTMSCSYGLVSQGKALKSVSITANQPFTVSDQIVTDWLDSLSFTAQPDIDGYKVFKKAPKNADDSTSYMLRKDGNSVKLTFSLIDQSKMDSLVETAAANLNSFAKNPKGISDVSYDSPTFTQKYPKACDLTDNEDIRLLSGVDASPLVREFWPTAIGVADFSSVSDYKTKTNYLRSQCIHLGNDPAYKSALSGTVNHPLQVTTTTYENEQASAKGLLYLAVGEPNDTKMAKSGVGQEAYSFKRDGQNILAFRQGRVVVELTYDFAKQDKDPTVSDQAKYTEKLAPVAQKIADKLKSL
jgi:hypothetical protein